MNKSRINYLPFISEKNPITDMVKELLLINEDFPLRVGFKNNTNEAITPNDYNMHIFEQIWGSTAGGFDTEIGGSAITTQTTYVFTPKNPSEEALVYFGSRFAYKVPFTADFIHDVKNHAVAPVSEKHKYKNEKEN